MYEIRMLHAVDITDDGLYHITNVVLGMRGQHHVHNKESYERWKKQGKIFDEYITIGPGKCNCGMKSGDCEEYDGHRWHNERFEKE